MPAGRPDAEFDRRAEDVGFDARAFIVFVIGDQPRVAAGFFAKSQNTRDVALFGARDEASGLRIVGGDQCCAAGQKAFEDFRLGVGDGLAGAEEFQMRRRDGRDQRHMRAHE